MYRFFDITMFPASETKIFPIICVLRVEKNKNVPNVNLGKVYLIFMYASPWRNASGSGPGYLGELKRRKSKFFMFVSRLQRTFPVLQKLLYDKQYTQNVNVTIRTLPKGT